jgi:hypothetical protein
MKFHITGLDVQDCHPIEIRLLVEALTAFDTKTWWEKEMKKDLLQKFYAVAQAEELLDVC